MTVMNDGASGSGKSSMLMNMPPDKVGIYNVTGKPLPFKKRFPYMTTVSDVDTIISSLRKNMFNCYVIDDSQYLMSFKLIDRWNDNGYAKYTEIARDFKRLIDVANKEVSPDTIVYFFHHTEVTDTGFVKAKTSGKMIDNWLTLEGLFPIVLMNIATENKHMVVTQSDGTNTCKSPIGMFDDLLIPNDLLMIDTTIREYYGLAKLGDVKKQKTEKNASVSTSAQVPKEG